VGRPHGIGPKLDHARDHAGVAEPLTPGRFGAALSRLSCRATGLDGGVLLGMCGRF